VRDLAGRELVDPPRRVIAFRPLRDDQQHRRVFGERDERLGELHRCRVGPVEVLEQDEDRAVLGETRQERCDDLERPVLERLGGELGQPGLGVGLEGQIEQRAQVRVDLGCPLAEEGLEVTAEGDPHAQLRSIHRDADPSPQEVAEGPVGQRLPVGDTAALEPDGSAVGGGRVLDLRRELGGETALADARLARHEEDAARPRERAFDGLAGFPELAFPSDELGLDALGPASGSGPNAASLERLDGLRLPLQLQLLGVAPVEQLLDLAPGFGADDDRTGIGSGLESRGRVDRVADRAVLDPAAGADRAEDDRAGRDRRPSRRDRRSPRRGRPPRRTPRRSAAILSPARTARSGSSSCVTGAPKSASTPSPARSLIVPPKSSTAWTMRAIASPTTSFASSGSSCSPSAVEPARSAKSAETTLRSSRICAVNPKRS